MTPVQKNTIAKIRSERTRYYTQQRVAPHYIEAYPQGTVMFQPHNNMQIPCNTHVNTEELLREVDEIIHNKGQKRGNLVLTPTATDSSISNSISDTAEPTAFTGAGHKTDQTTPKMNLQHLPEQVTRPTRRHQISSNG
jgi:hypothetical protein